MTVVVDASVVLKWLLRNPQNESETERATLLMQRILTGEEPIIQPAHWLIEVGAVLARVSPDSVQDDVLMLQALSLAIDDGPEVASRVPVGRRPRPALVRHSLSRRCARD